jgi:hypothetical protein
MTSHSEVAVHAARPQHQVAMQPTVATPETQTPKHPRVSRTLWAVRRMLRNRRVARELDLSRETIEQSPSTLDEQFEAVSN